MNNPLTVDKSVLIQGNRTPSPPLTVGMPGAGRWLASVTPSGSEYSQTMGGGQANVQVARSPGTRGAGFAGGAAPNSPFTLTVHGGGRVAVIKQSPGVASFGTGQKPYPAPASNAGLGAPIAGSTYHIEGGGAAFINGLAAVSGDVVSYGKHYTPGQPLPAFSLRGNPHATTDIVDTPIVAGTGLTISSSGDVHTLHALPFNAATTQVVAGFQLSQAVITLHVATSPLVTVTGVSFDAENCIFNVTTNSIVTVSSVTISLVTASPQDLTGETSGQVVVTNLSAAFANVFSHSAATSGQ